MMVFVDCNVQSLLNMKVFLTELNAQLILAKRALQTHCTCHYSLEHATQTVQHNLVPRQTLRPHNSRTPPPTPLHYNYCHLHTTQLVHKIQMLSPPCRVRLQKLTIAKLPRQFQPIHAKQVRHTTVATLNVLQPNCAMQYPPPHACQNAQPVSYF